MRVTKKPADYKLKKLNFSKSFFKYIINNNAGQIPFTRKKIIVKESYLVYNHFNYMYYMSQFLLGEK